MRARCAHFKHRNINLMEKINRIRYFGGILFSDSIIETTRISSPKSRNSSFG